MGFFRLIYFGDIRSAVPKPAVCYRRNSLANQELAINSPTLVELKFDREAGRNLIEPTLPVETLGSISWRAKRQADKRKRGGCAATPKE